MKNAVIYIHGKGGSATESEHYKRLFPDCDVFDLDYKTFTPWETGKEIDRAVIKLKEEYNHIILIANSIGAYFSMNAHIGTLIDKAYFISPIVDMEKLIADMMACANVTGDELKNQGVIHTDFGEVLSWDYLCYVREHSVEWNAPTVILYGRNVSLTSYETISAFAEKHRASLTVMGNGEHWFHTDEQMRFLDDWISSKEAVPFYRKHGLGISICNTCTDEINAVKPAGFVVSEQTETVMRLDLNKELPADLPDGLRYTELDSVKEPFAFQWLLWQSFDHGTDKAGFEKQEQIIPVKADAENLPFEKGFFDAVVLTDFYNYFGRDPAYLDEKLLPLVKPGGYIYITVPGMKEDCHNNLPPELLLSWTPEQLDYLHDVSYWKNIVEGCKGVEALEVSEMESNDEAWADWLRQENEYALGDRKAMEEGGEKYLNFIKIVLRKK